MGSGLCLKPPRFTIKTHSLQIIISPDLLALSPSGLEREELRSESLSLRLTGQLGKIRAERRNVSLSILTNPHQRLRMQKRQGSYYIQPSLGKPAVRISSPEPSEPANKSIVIQTRC